MAEVDRAFVVVGSATTVEAWAVAPLASRPTGWQVELRAELGAAIARLHGTAESSLAAAYVSPHADAPDAANVLVANVGIAAFAGVGAGGVIVERSTHVPLPPPVPLDGAADHYVRYEVTTHREPSYWSIGAPVAGFVADHVRLPLSPATTWWAVRHGRVRAGRRSTTGPLCLRVTVALPVVTRTTLLSTMKPLLDGVLAAFHRHDGAGIDEVVTRLATLLGAPPAAVRRQLEDEELDLLGTRNVVAPYRDGVMWNPAEDRVVAVDLRADVAPAPRISGDLFEVSML